MRFTRRTLSAVVVIGAIAAGGAAYTAGSGFGSVPTSSYSGTTIAGAATSLLTFNYSNDGTHILKAEFTLTPANGTDNYADEATYEIQAGFGFDSTLDNTIGATALQASTLNDPLNLTNGTHPNGLGAYCQPTAVTGSAPPVGSTTTVVCWFTPPGILVSNTNDIAPAGDNDQASGLGDQTNNPIPTGAGDNPLQGADQFNVLVTTIIPTS